MIKEFRNYRMYGVMIDDTIYDSFSITKMEYHKETFLLNNLIKFLDIKHFS